MNKRVLITGGTGLLGKALMEERPLDLDILAAFYPKDRGERSLKGINLIYLDVMDEELVHTVFNKYKPDIVIHTASIGSVDYVEKHPEEGHKVNVSGTINIMNVCKKYYIKFIYISSNAVFDGNSAPYSEKSIPNPINVYGRYKLECERMLENDNELNYCIVRPILMYGWNYEFERSNPVTWLIDKLRKNEEVPMVTDIYSNPLLSRSCAEAIYRIIQLDKHGIYNIAGKECVNRYDFAVKTAEVFGLNKSLIKPVLNESFKDIAPRPKNTCYITAKMEKELGCRAIGIIEGLTYMKNNRT